MVNLLYLFCLVTKQTVRLWSFVDLKNTSRNIRFKFVSILLQVRDIFGEGIQTFCWLYVEIHRLVYLINELTEYSKGPTRFIFEIISIKTLKSTRKKNYKLVYFKVFCKSQHQTTLHYLTSYIIIKNEFSM